MKKQLIRLCIALALSTCAYMGKGNTPIARTHALNQDKTYFLENKGQVTGDEASDVNYHFKSNGLSVFLLGSRIAYQFEKWEPHALNESTTLETYRMDLTLVGAAKNVRTSTTNRSDEYINFYNYGVLGVYGYQEITYHDVYPNIDWVVYILNDQLKYDFVVKPGGNPNQIKLRTRWAESLHLNADGGYTASCLMGSITEVAPLSYQDEAQIETKFVLDTDVLTFDIGEYDPTSVLRIDPNVVWSTYYGGSGIDYGNAVAQDSKGNIYLTGDTKSSSNIASGGHQNTYGGTYYDAMLVKLNSNGVRQWATYFGGSGEDRAFAIAIDGSDNVYIAGHTRSTNGIYKDGFKSKLSGVTDAFLAKFNSSGTHLWGTYYGLGGLDDGKAIAIDKSNNVYLSGSRKTNNYSGYFAKFNSAGKHQWYRTLGSNSFATYGSALCLDKNGNIFMGGYTYLNSGIAKNGHQNTYGGSADAYLVKYNDQGTVQWGTYYGGTNAEYATAVTSDDAGNLYLIGSTQSTAGIASSGHQNTFGGARDAFIVKFNNSGKRQWASYYGGSGNEDFNAIALDTARNLYLVGNAASTSGIAYKGLQNTYGGGNQDAFLVKLDDDGKREWATYFGGTDLDYGKGVFVNDKDNIYFGGYTLSKSFYGKKGHQNTFGGNRDAFLAKISQCIADPGTDVQTACDSYKWIDGKTYTESTNTPQFTLTSSDGCDSLVTLNLTIHASPKRTYIVNSCGSYTVDSKTYTQSGDYTYTKASGVACDSAITLKLTITTVKTDVVVNGSTLSAVDASGTYQWLNCANNAPVPGETRRSFKATANGDYAVEITKNNCVDTSICTNVKPVGIENLKKLAIQVYPNPSDGLLTIDLSQLLNVSVSLYSTEGQRVFHKTGIKEPQFTLATPELKGIFLLKISTRDVSKVVRVLIL